ncbi:MAG: hypothetical protein DSY55_00125 [Clostridia bacterium]|nr:MAG: hypothetical protein DSY55_00125 [Clostridia bacterium]
MTVPEIATTISYIWKEVLNVDEVGLHDHFYDLGGNPKLLDTMRLRLQLALKVDVTLVDLSRYPTVISLAQYYANGEVHPSPISESYRRAQRQRRLIAQRYPLRMHFVSAQT